MFRAYRYTKRRHPVQGEERWMLYGDRGYGIAHSRTKEAFGRALRGGDEHAREEDSGVSARLDASGAGRGVPAVRYRRLRRAT